jgi:hypothetical protein
MTALHALLEWLIDYAGLFPPASLDMKTAVRNYSTYRASDEAWMLGRFVVPAHKLTEFSAAFAEACCGEQTSPWLLSVLSTGDEEEDLRFVQRFSEGAAFLDAIEFKAVNLAQAEKRLGAVPSGMAAYVEFPLGQSDLFLPSMKESGARAKIRTGGVTAEAIPSAQEIASFLIACAKARVSFKATAGLHHPLRSTQKLTYEEKSATAAMHGFINVFVAAVVAYQGSPEEDVLAVLNEQSPSAFQWEKGTLTWRHHHLPEKLVKEVRENFAIGFGSCSFTEPVNDLKGLGWL